jgi:hypothetical protein
MLILQMEFEKLWAEPAALPYYEALFQGLVILPFAIAWAMRRYRPFVEWQARRGDWHVQRLHRESITPPAAGA